MKRIIPIILALCTFTYGAKAQENLPQIDLSTSGKNAKITFNKTQHNFGKIIQGDTAKTVFSFVNTGTDTLKLTQVKAGCGCTVPRWPRQPIAPGDSSEIKVEFRSRGKSGAFTKTVMVSHNGETAKEYLVIKGLIEPKQTKASNIGQEPSKK